MNKFIAAALVLALGILLMPADSSARGFGGFHGGGSFGGFHGGGFSGGSFGGFRTDSFGGGGYRAGGFGGDSFHAGGYEGGAYHAGGYEGGAYRAGGFEGGAYHAGGFEGGAYHAGAYGSVNRGQLDSFLGLPTDGGFHAAAGAEGHVYQGAGGTTVAHASAGVRGAAVGPEGAAAGGRYASGTAVKGPEGNVYTHDTTAGRGIAAGPNGVEAGHYAGSRTAVNGATVAGRGYAGYGTYGTHPWSPTYYHSQALAGQSWCYGNHLYSRGWCTIHPWAWLPAGYAAADWAAAAWDTATWDSLGSWLGYVNPEPYSYNYGNQIVYNDGEVYYANQAAGTAQQYYQEAVDLASSPAATDTGTETQWLPLGVFGLMANGKKTPDMVFQLAVDKKGTIRGNYFDQVTQTNLPVTGAVNKQSQRVAWKVAAGQGIVVETGLQNLTENESTALVHFGPDRTEQDLLVRIKQPAQSQTAASN